MKTATATKLTALVELYRLGQREEASKKVRALSRLELFDLLVNDHKLENGFLGDRNSRYDFAQFVERALEGCIY